MVTIQASPASPDDFFNSLLVHRLKHKVQHLGSPLARANGPAVEGMNLLSVSDH